MEPIYGNVESTKRHDPQPPTNQSDSKLVRHSWDVQTNLTDQLQASRDDRSAMTVEIDSLKANVTKQSTELERLHAASRLGGRCPDRWTRFSGSCYSLSTQALSWEKAREFCIKEGANLVTIDNAEEQEFVSEKITGDTWIGLNDREEEGTWKWAMDNSPLIHPFWSENQPDNGGQNQGWGEEDCVHLQLWSKKWNDLRCNYSTNCMCEKMA
ncbi:CD209 antigen-like isoform X2 [Nelusetta ayraudi]|uniref:CD209 antigen-like isoform X2 n=1 Tax=Nelusetta ayraudi TaxID=303726 RepID=UPI003F70DFC2